VIPTLLGEGDLGFRNENLTPDKRMRYNHYIRLKLSTMVYEIDKYKKKFIYIHVKNISKNE
jgi:hypothetical protein